MHYRAFTVSAILAISTTITGVVAFAPLCRADIVASDSGIAVRDAGVAAPARGMTMAQVASKFGDPVSKVPAVGSPPISRWEYSGFVVYFERDHVIHAVVSESAPMESSGSASPPAAAEAPVPAPEPATAAVVQAPTAQTSMTSVSVSSPAAPPAPAEAPPAAPAPAESEASPQP
jgi:hypothetical protein